MFDARAAAKNRAVTARDSLFRLEQQLDRERRELAAARADGSITTDDAAAVEDLIQVDVLRVTHAAHVAELLEEIGRGKRVLR
jgi:hypothetical protein